MSAISWSSLIMRQPAVTGVALVRCSAGAALVRLSVNTNLTVSSTPTRPVLTPRSRSPFAISANGLSSSCHTSSWLDASGPAANCSRKRSSSKAGQTQKPSPRAVSTIAEIRSLPPRRAPLK